MNNFKKSKFNKEKTGSRGNAKSMSPGVTQRKNEKKWKKNKKIRFKVTWKDALKNEYTQKRNEAR